jgi:hypothetical protein
VVLCGHSHLLVLFVCLFVCLFVRSFVNSADAVYFPRAIEDPKVLEQEGWHYEVDEKGDLIYNGVV